MGWFSKKCEHSSGWRSPISTRYVHEENSYDKAMYLCYAVYECETCECLFEKTYHLDDVFKFLIPKKKQ